jgi:hypothetical protein
VNDNEISAWMVAVMLHVGVTEIRMNDRELVDPPDATLVRYRDEVARVTAFRLVNRDDVIDGEEVPAVAITMGGRA